MNCQACGKFFSGEVPWTQHLSSEKHKKKIALLNNYDRNPESVHLNLVTQPKENGIHCPVCNITFDSAESYQVHSLSKEHAINVTRKWNKDENFDATVSTTNITKDPTNSKLLNLSIMDETDKVLPDMPDMPNSKMSQMSSLSCIICSKHFSGPEPYKQHMESSTHKRKAELQNSASAAAVQNVLGPLSCDICKKMFSGAVPYEQHIISDGHKKKIKNLEFLEKFKADKSSTDCDSSGDKSYSITDNRFQMENNPFFCKLCNVPCSGAIPFQQHLSGETHMKNSKRIHPSESNISNSEFKPAVSQLCNENAHAAVQQKPSLPFTSNENSNYVIPEMADRIKLVSAEDIKIKAFLPEDVVDLDALQSNADNDSLMNISEDQIHSPAEYDKGREENSDALQCRYCNIELKNLKETVAHFESVEHFMRNWSVKDLK